MSVLALDQTHELRALVGVHRASGLFVHSAVDGLCADDLRCGRHQRRQTCRQTHRRNKLHCARQDILGLQLFELSDHVRVHTARNLGLLHELVGCGEAEVGLDLLRSVEQTLPILGLSILDALVEQCVDLCGQRVGKRIERLGQRFLGAEYRHFELLADALQLAVDLGHGLHVDTQIDAELLAEYVYQLQCGRSRAAAEPPAVGVDDIDSGHDCRHDRCQTVTRRTVGVEIDGDADVLLEELDERRYALRRNQTRHILDRYHVGAQLGHLLGLVEEILVGKDHFMLLAVGILGIDGVAYGAVGDAAVLLDIFDSRLDVIDIVQRIEYTHDAQTALDSVARETCDDLVGVGRVAEQVAAARECREIRYVADGLLDRFQTSPRVFVEVAHHRVGYGAAPNLHSIEVGVLVVGQAAIDLLLGHTRSERRLLTVAQRQITNFQCFSHSLKVLSVYCIDFLSFYRTTSLLSE